MGDTNTKCSDEKDGDTTLHDGDKSVCSKSVSSHVFDVTDARGEPLNIKVRNKDDEDSTTKSIRDEVIDNGVVGTSPLNSVLGVEKEKSNESNGQHDESICNEKNGRISKYDENSTMKSIRDEVIDNGVVGTSPLNRVLGIEKEKSNESNGQHDIIFLWKISIP